MLNTHPHEWTLPSPEERRKIMERAGFVLAQARTLMEQLDHSESQLFWNRQAGKEVGVCLSWQPAGGHFAASSSSFGQVAVS